MKELFQFVERVDWIHLKLGSFGSLSIDYYLGVDGLSISLVLLTGLITFIASLDSWSVEKKARAYQALFLLLSGTLMGCFVALDFFLFYLFFEFMLLPMYFLIGIWGGERREYAAIKFFIYTLLGSILILIVMIVLAFTAIDLEKSQAAFNPSANASQTKILSYEDLNQKMEAGQINTAKLVHSLDIILLMNPQIYQTSTLLNPEDASRSLGLNAYQWVFLALLLGFLIKLPSVPFHTWLPDAHVEASTPISVVLAGVLLKVGAYGIIRLAYGIFPEAAHFFSPFIALLATLSIIYGALNALAMADLKKMIAYSSVSHMGFVLLGICSLNSIGLNGALFQMFSHGLLSALLFLIAGVLYDRTRDRSIASYRGLQNHLPVFSFWVALAFFASLGLPGFSGFIGELFSLMGAFRSSEVPLWMAVLSTFGILLSAAYFLWTYQRMFLGSFWIRGKEKWLDQMSDLNGLEKFLLGTLGFLSLLFGLFPQIIFSKINQSIEYFSLLF
ncbi:MAG: NADH-quinone oxidoreductase subunit M [Bacteroidota bacterium]